MDGSTGKSWKIDQKNCMVRYDPMKTSPDMKDRKFMKSEESALNQQNKCSFNIKYLENF